MEAETPGTQLPRVIESEVKEIFVIEGTWADDLGEYSARTWLRYPPGYRYTAASSTGCMLYVKTYQLPQVRFHYDSFAA
jgi:ChrR Cupin-like domain